MGISENGRLLRTTAALRGSGEYGRVLWPQKESISRVRLVSRSVVVPDAILSAGTNFGDVDNTCELHALTTLLGPRTTPQKPNYPISFPPPVTLVIMTMSWFSGLDSPASGYESPSSSFNTQLALHHVSTVLLSLANSAETSVETNLGLSESALIALDIIQIAQVHNILINTCNQPILTICPQHAKSYRNLCADIADQTYQLLNAVDGGIKGRAIDVNFILKDHIRRLNEYVSFF